MSTYTCHDCGNLIIDGHPYHNVSGHYMLCLDCALKCGYAWPMVWLELHGFGIYDRAEYHDGKIIAFQKWGKGYRKDVIEVV